jgi:hypothetical protein
MKRRASVKKPATKKVSADTTAAVDAFMATLKHPHKPAIEALRRIIGGADPSISEGVEWNAPSFRAGEYFATTQDRAMVVFAGLNEVKTQASALRDIVRQWIKSV